MMYLLLIIGFFLLVKGADYFVEGSSAVAAAESPLRGYRLTIVAMGTSAPEAAVSITAGLAGSNELALSNVIGSNLFNLVLIVGICALIRPFIVDQSIMKRDFPVAILSSILLLFFIRDNFLSRIEGVILLILMAAYLIATVTSAIRNQSIWTKRQSIFRCTPAFSIFFLGWPALLSAETWLWITPAALPPPSGSARLSSA